MMVEERGGVVDWGSEEDTVVLVWVKVISSAVFCGFSRMFSPFLVGWSWEMTGSFFTATPAKSTLVTIPSGECS